MLKQSLQVMSWIAVILGAITVISGLTQLNTDPTNAYYSLLGGILFGVEGSLALAYISKKG